MTLTERLHLEHPAHDDGQRAVAALIQRIGLTDLLIIIWAVMGAQLIRFGQGAPHAKVSAASFEPEYTLFSVVLIGVWVLMLRIHGAHDQRLLGHGPEEYMAVATASCWLLGAMAFVSYVLRLEVARGYVAMALPAGMIGLLVSRRLWRAWLTLHRTQGLMSASVLVVGDYEPLANLIRTLDRVPEAGYQVVAACCSDAGQTTIGQIPVLGDASQAAEVAARIGVHTIACTSSSRLGTDGLRRLSWSLEGQDVDLVVAPELTDVAGPRVLTRPVAGLSLLHVEAPHFAGPQLAVKTVIDRVGATALLVLLSPLLAGVALLVWRHDRGPVFFRHERIGLEGKVFRMFKFRTMVTNAEALLPSLLASTGQEASPLYKVRADPRVTPIGSWLRRYSIDELPQLVNVLRGEMSLVGPRPQVIWSALSGQ